MEVNLVSCAAFPEDAIVSIRAGSVRRQATLGTGRSFRFPQLAPDANPVKIDILKPVGSAYLVLKPGEEHYRLTFDSGMSAEVEVKGVDVNKPSVAEEPNADSKLTAKEAKDYLDRHQVLPLVQAVVQAVLKERPADPFVHIARHFLNGYLPDALAEQASVKPETTNASQSEETLKNELIRADGKTTRPEQTESASIDALRQEAANSLFRAAEDGRLQEALAKTKGASANYAAKPTAEVDPMDLLRNKAANSLLKAAEDGTLEKALAMTKGMEAPVADDRSIDVVRKEAASCFSQAAEDGTLESALAKAKEATAAAEDTAPAAGADPEKTSAKAKGTPAEEGEATPTAGMDPVELLRKEAANSLLRAAEDGMLEKALAAAKGTRTLRASKESSDLPRKEADNSSLRAAEDSTLDKALANTEGTPAAHKIDDVRRDEAASVLIRAAKDGTFEKALIHAMAEEAAADPSLHAPEDGTPAKTIEQGAVDKSSS